MRKKIIVTGGAGYIGSHTILELLEQDQYDVISIDNYSNSSPKSLKALEKYTGREIIQIELDLCNALELKKVLKIYQSDVVGVIHFAALKSVGDSVQMPINYYQNNLNSLLNVLAYCQENEVNYFIFSSSCSVYGDVEEGNLPVTEKTPVQLTECPYAETKAMGERILKDVAGISNLKTMALRYFNPVGAHSTNLIGENAKSKPNNLVPIIARSALGLIPPMSVFGTDYPTRDGSCIRDYIHVVDIAKAHVKAMDYLVDQQQSDFEIINLGSGNGVSVLEAITAFEKVSGRKLDYHLGPRRAGDVVMVYSDSSKAQQKLGWTAQMTIDQMMLTAWNWEQKLAKS